jgi:hypothetical protein
MCGSAESKHRQQRQHGILRQLRQQCQGFHQELLTKLTKLTTPHFKCKHCLLVLLKGIMALLTMLTRFVHPQNVKCFTRNSFPLQEIVVDIY